jgi:hypothetical protein
MVRRISRAFTFLFFALLALSVAGACYVLFTTAGSSAAVKAALNQSLGGTQVSIESFEGSLARGLTLRGLTCERLAQFPPGSALSIERLHASVRPFHFGSSHIDIQNAVLSIPDLMPALSISRGTGDFSGRLSLHDVRVEVLKWLPENTVLEVQQVDVAHLWSPTPVGRREFWVPLWVRKGRELAPAAVGEEPARPWLPELFDRVAVELFNGRLRLPASDPLAFSGSLRSRQLDVAFYSNSLGVRELAGVVFKGGEDKRLSGAFADVHGRLFGPLDEPTVEGGFHLPRMARGDFAMVNCPGSFEFQFKGLRKHKLRLHGHVLVKSGTLTAKNTVIALRPSRIEYEGDPRRPQYDIHGSAIISGTKITIALRGDKTNPELKLSSDPPMAEERLLIMLATGKGWKGDVNAFQQGRVSTDLASDFIDYFVFGGLGDKLAKKVGISDWALTYDDETRRVGVTTTLVDRVDLNYETDQLTGAEEPVAAGGASPGPPVTYKVGAEYKVTESTTFAVEGEREVAPHRSSGTTTTGPTDPGVAEPTADEVWLKIKRKF